MGYMRHHTIVVTCWHDEHLAEAHAKAKEVFEVPSELGAENVAYVTEITPVTVNGYRSFMVAPDGSKEGWGHSDQGDEARDKFVGYLNRVDDEGEAILYLDWVEVQFADDDFDTTVIRDSDERVRLGTDPTIEDLKRIQREQGLGSVHVCWIGPNRFVIAHTDEERTWSRPLEACPLHQWFEHQDWPPSEPGYYTVLDPYSHVLHRLPR